MIRILSLAGFISAGFVGFWQIASGSVSAFTPYFLVAMSIAFIFLFAGINRIEEEISLQSRTAHGTLCSTIMLAELLKDAVELKIGEKDLEVRVLSKSEKVAEGVSFSSNQVSVRPISDAGKQALINAENKHSELMRGGAIWARRGSLNNNKF